MTRTGPTGRQWSLMFLAAVSALVIIVSCILTYRESLRPVITTDDAIKIARDKCKELDFNVSHRQVECTRAGPEYIVDFLVPRDSLGGVVSIRINAFDGEVTGGVFRQ